MLKKKKSVEKICGNCMLYNNSKEECKVAILSGGEEIHMPVHFTDKCHFESLGIEVQQVRWWAEDENGNISEKGKVKIEYPENFFGKGKE